MINVTILILQLIKQQQIQQIMKGTLISQVTIPFWVLITVITLNLAYSKQFTVPLTYALDPVSSEKKYPIVLSFNTSQTITPFSSSSLPLYNLNLTLQTVRSTSNIQQVIIGLKQPSSFLAAIRQNFKVQSRQIQLGKDEYTQLIVKGNNFVQSTDEFVNGGMYKMKAMYNFGDPLTVQNQKCLLVDDENVIFDEFLILQILNSMDKRNKIRYSKNQSKSTITIDGDIQNFPKISFIAGKSIFQLQLKLPTILYIPRTNQSESITKIGYKTLTKFSKLQIEKDNKIIFKRTSQLYQLYLFLGYFFIFTLIFIIIARDKFQGSMKFVRNVIDWAIFQSPEARVNVLRTELQ